MSTNCMFLPVFKSLIDWTMQQLVIPVMQGYLLHK
uniref:Uncharacterized protein n=1 Tax=Anguilla anguilla TaxID=7936 RepID=A0A0E9S6H3_ANGAN